MPTRQPNEGKRLPFTLRVRNPKNNQMVPAYIAPDATNEVQGDVFLSDDINSNLDAASGMTAASPKAVKQLRDKLDTERNITITNGAQQGTAKFKCTTDIAVALSNLDATTLIGEVPIASIPKVALDVLKNVPTIEARNALTTDDVQVGDSVYVIDTEQMFLVVDDENLDNDAGYKEYRPRTPIMEGATEEDNGVTGTVPAPTTEDIEHFLKGDGTWSKVTYDTLGTEIGVVAVAEDEPIDPHVKIWIRA